VKLLLPLALAAALLAAPVADARKPVIAYVDDATSKLKLYDAETATEVPAPDLAIPQVNNVARFSVSHDGRYVGWVDADNELHLLDRASGAELPLPGIDVYASPGNPSVSNTGLFAFDNNSNGPALVYDSDTRSFRDTGLAADNGHRQTVLSGDGRFLATTCNMDCVSDLGGDSSVYIQNLVARRDTLFPDNLSGSEAQDEEHPCVDGDGSVAGADVDLPGTTDKDVRLFDRVAAGLVNPPANPNSAGNDNDDVYCVLDGDARYLGFWLQTATTNTFRLFDLQTGRFETLPANKIAIRQVSLTQPFPPPQPPPPDADGAPPGDTAAPLFDGPVTVTNRVFRVGPASVARRRARPRGTAFRYTLSEPAQLGVAIERRAAGRRVGTRCRAATRRLRKRPRCTRWLPRGSFAASAVAGPNRTPFSGRIRRRALKRGRYRARLAATDAAGNRSAEQRVRFRIVRR
jgi:hypothetical protein